MLSNFRFRAPQRGVLRTARVMLRMADGTLLDSGEQPVGDSHEVAAGQDLWVAIDKGEIERAKPVRDTLWVKRDTESGYK